MIRIDAVYRVTTPLFMAGAEPANSPELRLPGLKAALRFWFRAVAWPRLHDVPERDRVRRIREEEAGLFGSTDTGQSRFLLRLQRAGDAKPGTITFERRGGVIYLGYGLMDYNGKLSRQYLAPGFDVHLTLLSRTATRDHLVAAREALIALGLFGAVGSRARHGFGSLSLQSISGDAPPWASPNTRDGLEREIETFVKNLPAPAGGHPPFTAFSRDSRVIVTPAHADPLALLDRIGIELQVYRSYGRDGRVAGRPAEQNFRDDHDLVLGLTKGQSPTTHPRRVVFGLPHNYFFQSTRAKAGVTAEETDRRASPLMLHVHQVGKEYAAVASLFPAEFLGANDHVVMKAAGRSVQVPVAVDYSVIGGFLDRLEKLEVSGGR